MSLVIDLNPMYHLLEVVRRPLLAAGPADWRSYAVAALFVAVLAAVASAVIGSLPSPHRVRALRSEPLADPFTSNRSRSRISTSAPSVTVRSSRPSGTSGATGASAVTVKALQDVTLSIRSGERVGPHRAQRRREEHVAQGARRHLPAAARPRGGRGSHLLAVRVRHRVRDGSHRLGEHPDASDAARHVGAGDRREDRTDRRSSRTSANSSTSRSGTTRRACSCGWRSRRPLP